jgi:hypothetical protein
VTIQSGLQEPDHLDALTTSLDTGPETHTMTLASREQPMA